MAISSGGQVRCRAKSVLQVWKSESALRTYGLGVGAGVGMGHHRLTHFEGCTRTFGAAVSLGLDGGQW